MMFNDERSSRASLVAINFYEAYLEIKMFEIWKKSMRIILQPISKPSRLAVTELLFDLEKQKVKHLFDAPYILIIFTMQIVTDFFSRINIFF